MRLIVFIGEHYPAEAQLAELVRLANCRHKIEINHTVAGFLEAILRPVEKKAVALALLATLDDLKALAPLRDISQDIPLILVLPDSEPATISLGHRLRPRFLGFLQNGFSEAGVFLSEFLKRNERDGRCHEQGA